MVTRDLLNDFPDWALGLIVVSGTVIVALVGFALVRRFLTAWRAERSSQVIGGADAMVMTIFALVLAFVIVNLYSSYDGATNNVAAEATSLTELVQDAGILPPAVRSKVNRAVALYALEVRDREFGKLRDGRDDPRAQELLGNVIATLEAYSPTTNAQGAFYSSATSTLHSIISERESRLDAAETTIPKPLLVLMIILAVLTLAISLLIETHTIGVDLVIVVSIAIVVSAGLLTALILQYPFSGSIAVNSDPFNTGLLGHLVRGYG